MSQNQSLKHIKKAQMTIRNLIMSDISQYPDHKEYLQYSLKSGKRIRSMIALSFNPDNIAQILSVEYFHTSHILLDAMDNNILTIRGAPAMHIRYGPHITHIIAHMLTLLAMKHSGSVDIEPLMYGLNLSEPSFIDKSPREQKDLFMQYIQRKSQLFSISFPIHLEQAGHCYGICCKLVSYIKHSHPLLSYVSKNDLIDTFTDNIEMFAIITSEHNAWNPILTELYNYLLTSFKKCII
jgi:hypothetical protein